MTTDRKRTPWPNTLLRLWLIACLSLMTYSIYGEFDSSKIITLLLPALWAGVLMFRYRWLERTQAAACPVFYALALIFAVVCVQVNTSHLNSFSKTFYLAKLLTDRIEAPAFRALLFGGVRSFLRLQIVVGVSFLFLNVLPFLWKQLARFWQGLSKTEKRILLLFTTFFCLLVFVLVRTTTLFSVVYFSDKDLGIILEDKLYGLDTGYILRHDAYSWFKNMENDIRNPWFAHMCMPFGVIANLVARLLPQDPYAYTVALLCLQIAAIQLCIVLFSRMVDSSPKNRLLFMLVMEASYPVLIFSLNAEQYVFPVLWLTLLVYSFVRRTGNGDWWFIAATGSISSSVLALPFLFDWRKGASRLNLQTFWRMLWKTATVFILTATYARIPELLERLELMLVWNEATSFQDRAFQFINAATLAFIRTPGAPNIINGRQAYNMLPITGVNWLGVLVFLLAAIGLALNRKNRFAWACGYWVLVSVIIELLFGWGSTDNGMMVHAYYFFWAYVALVCMAVFRLLERTPRLRTALFVLTAAVMLALNFSELVKIIGFGMETYPYS